MTLTPISEPCNLKRQQLEFCAHLRNPEISKAPPGIEDRRMKIYRELFYKNIESFLSNGFPVIHKIFEPARWHAMVRDFFHRHHCQTPYFHQICEEFIAYLQSERSEALGAEEDPEFLLELAHYEWVELALDIDESEVCFLGCELDFISNADSWKTSKPQLSPLAWVQTYAYPVHKISKNFMPEKPSDVPVCLVVYRDRNDKVRFMEINPFTARFLSMLGNDSFSSLNALLESLSAEIGTTLTDIKMPTTNLLKQLSSADILI